MKEGGVRLFMPQKKVRGLVCSSWFHKGWNAECASRLLEIQWGCGPGPRRTSSTRPSAVVGSTPSTTNAWVPTAEATNIFQIGGISRTGVSMIIAMQRRLLGRKDGIKRPQLRVTLACCCCRCFSFLIEKDPTPKPPPHL